ncbi:MAG: O-antigen ligase family protein [Acidimicrobiia bacterium]
MRPGPATAVLLLATALVGGAIALDERIGIAVLGVASATVLARVPSWMLLAAATVMFRWFPSPLIGDLAATDLLLLMFVARGLGPIVRNPIRAALRWLLGFTVVAWASTLLAGVTITPLLRVSLYVAVTVVLTQSGGALRRPVLRVIVGYATIVVLVSALTQSGERMFGETVGDPQQLGILLLAALAPLATREFTYRGCRLTTLVLILGIAATQTRGVWLAALVFALLHAVRRINRRRLVGMAVVVISTGLLLYGPVTRQFDLNPVSQEYRAQSIRSGIDIVRAHPVDGIGWAALSDGVDLDGPLPVPYNLFVLVATYTGLAGLACFGLFLWSVVGQHVRTADRTAFVFVGSFLVISMSEPTFYAGSLATFLFFLYAGFSLARSDTSTPHSPVGAQQMVLA